MTHPSDPRPPATPRPAPQRPARRSSRPLQWLGIAAGTLALMQLVPYGRAHTNPPVQVQPAWDSPDTAHLFERACADCHSNQTKWPWYSNVAPVSWLVQNHVDEGRSKFNVNVPGYGHSADEAAEQVASGEMPEKTYLPMHPEARLTPAETEALVRGLQATLGSEGGGEGGAKGMGGGQASEQGEGTAAPDND